MIISCALTLKQRASCHKISERESHFTAQLQRPQTFYYKDKEQATLHESIDNRGGWATLTIACQLACVGVGPINEGVLHM